MKRRYNIELLNKKQHDISDFDCGNKELNEYLKERANQDSERNITAVYIIRESASYKVIGYYTLSSGSIELAALPKTIIKKLPKYPAVPTILLGRLAVDKRFQGHGIGKNILLDALYRAYKNSRQIGSYAVIVDAKDRKSGNFYEKYGFIRLKSQRNKFFLPMKIIENLIKN